MSAKKKYPTQFHACLAEQAEGWNTALASAGCEALQAWEWGDLKQKTGGWNPFRLGVFEADRLIGGIQILERDFSAGPLRMLRIHYAPRGPVMATDDGEACRTLLDAALSLSRSRSATLLKLDPMWSPDSSYAKLFAKRPWREVSGGSFGGLQPKAVMTLRLDRSEDELLGQMHHKWRYNIRLAEKKGVMVLEWPSLERPFHALDDILDSWYKRLLETARRDKFLVRGKKYFSEMLRLLGKAEMARLFLAHHEENLLGGILCTRWGPRVVYNYGASGNEGRSLMFSHLLQWRAICWAKSVGADIYDFRGVAVRGRDPSEAHLHGLDRFKSGFGAQYKEYIGEFDAVLRPVQYALWRLSPKIMAILKKRKGLAQLD